MRSYDEYCAIAKSLDVVGDRWTLLIVRELALRGACRYTDVRNGLPGIASNPRGEQLRPVLEDLTLWGLPLMTEQKPGDAVRSHWLASALELMLTDRQPDA